MAQRTCTRPGCNKPHRARGLCGSHYNQEHAPNRHAKKLVACAFCGKGVMKGTGGGKGRRPTCSTECRTWLTSPWCRLPDDHWARWYGRSSRWKPLATTMTVAERGMSQRSALRRAIEAGDSLAILDELFDMTTLTDAGCWQWSRQSRDGYPVFSYMESGKQRIHRVHRLSLEADIGKPLGKQAAHHVCANSMCVNPDHLQPISTRENTAEMMQRTFYIQRISELEAALREASPQHPLLAEFGIGLAS